MCLFVSITAISILHLMRIVHTTYFQPCRVLRFHMGAACSNVYNMGTFSVFSNPPVWGENTHKEEDRLQNRGEPIYIFTVHVYILTHIFQIPKAQFWEVSLKIVRWFLSHYIMMRTDTVCTKLETSVRPYTNSRVGNSEVDILPYYWTGRSMSISYI